MEFRSESYPVAVAHIWLWQ